MASFNSGKNLAIVIQCHDNEKEVLARLSNNTPSLFGLGRFAYILHDKDVLDNGEIKGKHIHIVYCATCGKSSNNWIKHFADGLGIPTDAVSVEMQQSEKKCLRYLLHLDDGAKHQYDRSEVVTNMDGECKRYWDTVSQYEPNPSFEKLEKAYSEGPRALLALVGPSAFKKCADAMETVLKYEQRKDWSQRWELDNQCALDDLKAKIAEMLVAVRAVRRVTFENNWHNLIVCLDKLWERSQKVADAIGYDFEKKEFDED